jgi:tRNA(Ile)-lysidine synthase
MCGYAEETVCQLQSAYLALRFLFSQAQQLGAQAVVVGHTADDQVETVLMHLLRGAGMAGLKGMSFVTVPNAWSQDIPLVRPLLTFWREEILNYCTEHHLDPVHDRSNLDTTYFRNRLRGELIPYLETYNPNIKRLLYHMTETLAGDYQLIEQITTTAWQACIRVKGEGFLSINDRPSCSNHYQCSEISYAALLPFFVRA